MNHLSQVEELWGKTAPEAIHMGSRTMFMIAWKPGGDSIFQASQKPMAVTTKEIRNKETRSPKKGRSWKVAPTKPAKMSTRRPWKVARVAPPNILPMTMAARDTGATMTD